MISSDVIRGYNDTIILHLLRISDSYGYKISKKIEELTQGNYVMKETTLYATLSRLQKNGYISSYKGEETQGGKRTYYTITREGDNYYSNKCREWELTQSVINIFLERKYN